VESHVSKCAKRGAPGKLLAFTMAGCEKQIPPASAALGVGMTNPKSDRAVTPTRELREVSIDYFFSESSMVARVFSQSMYMWQPLPISWKEIVKFSTGPEVFETLMS